MAYEADKNVYGGIHSGPKGNYISKGFDQIQNPTKRMADIDNMIMVANLFQQFNSLL